MKKTNSTGIIALLVSLFVMASFSACTKNVEPETPDDPDKQQEEILDEGIYIEEDEEAEIHKVDTDLSKFYGSWTALSEKAQYMYGNVDIIVNEDKTWSADITGEKLKGTWTDEGDHIHMANEMFSFDLALTESGNVVMIEDLDDDDLVTVLTRK